MQLSLEYVLVRQKLSFFSQSIETIYNLNYFCSYLFLLKKWGGGGLRLGAGLAAVGGEPGQHPHGPWRARPAAGAAALALGARALHRPQPWRGLRLWLRS